MLELILESIHNHTHILSMLLNDDSEEPPVTPAM